MQTFGYLIANLFKIRTHSVHFIDKANTWNFVFIRLSPHCLGLCFYPADRTEHRNRTIQHAKRTLHLDGEIDVAWGIDQV